MPLIDALLAGEPRAIARALSLVENGGQSAEELLDAVRARTRRAAVIGVTGPPGAGKSTLLDRLIVGWRKRDRRVGVLAVDPSSPVTGGAILGDRVRMQTHATDRGIFIRSMATRGAMGGLSRAVRDAVDVLDAAGFNPVVVETVGVGQAEIDIAGLADLVLVVTVPGTGDDVQALKAGLMEVGDLFIVNKADREGAARAIADLEAMIALDDRAEAAWRPRVIATVATEGQGVDELLAAIEEFERTASTLIDRRRHARASRGAAGLRLDHVAVAVEKPDPLLAFLCDTLGLSAGEVEEVSSSGVRVRFVDSGGVPLEIVEPAAASSPIERFLATRGPGLHHVAFRVPDLPLALARMRSAGVRLIDDVPRPGAHGSRIAFVHPSSTGGVLVELVERRPGADGAARESR
jgi:LAO/AO transport system kinase